MVLYDQIVLVDTDKVKSVSKFYYLAYMSSIVSIFPRSYKIIKFSFVRGRLAKLNFYAIPGNTRDIPGIKQLRFSF